MTRHLIATRYAESFKFIAEVLPVRPFVCCSWIAFSLSLSAWIPDR